MDAQTLLVNGPVAGAITYYLGLILTDLYGWEDKRAKKLILWLSLSVAIATEAAKHWEVIQAALGILFAWIGAFAQSQGWFKAQQDKRKGADSAPTEDAAPPAVPPTPPAPSFGWRPSDQGGSDA